MHRSITRRSWIAGAASLSAQTDSAAIRLPKRLRVALIGVDGHIAEITSPLKVLPDVELVAVAEPDPRAMRKVARSAVIAKAKHYADYRQMLDREKPDVVSICGPNGDRAEAILACAERRLHVAAEKPLTTERADFERVRRAVKESGIKLTMLLPMRFYPIYAAIKQIVDSGEIGEVAQMGAQKSYQVAERPPWMRRHASFGGTIPYIGIHMVDLMRFVSGRELTEAASFQGHIGYPELGDMENTTSTIFRLDNGGTAALRMDYLRPEAAGSHGDDRIRVAGTKGVVEHMAATGLTLITNTSKPRVITQLPPHKSLFVDFLDHVYNGRPVGLTLNDIYRANEIVFAARESAEKRQIVKT